tara:strand:- start:101 stop:304 length:204 start_codon:yes stop_codon:yes gene_type:complete
MPLILALIAVTTLVAAVARLFTPQTALAVLVVVVQEPWQLVLRKLDNRVLLIQAVVVLVWAAETRQF